MTSPNVQSGPGPSGGVPARTGPRPGAPAERSVTLWSGSLDEVGSILINAGRELARAEELLGKVDDGSRAEAELYAALADGLAARLRSLG